MILGEIYGMIPLWKVTFVALGIWGIGHAAVCAQAQCSDITWAELKGDIDPSQHPGFAPVPSNLTYKSSIYLRTEALEALEDMAAAARSDGINLQVVSAMRTWSHQRRIWNGKWNSARFMGFTGAARASEILRYSSMPGSSRHHWGTDVDLNALENEHFESGAGAAVYAWLLANAYDSGCAGVRGHAQWAHRVPRRSGIGPIGLWQSAISAVTSTCVRLKRLPVLKAPHTATPCTSSIGTCRGSMALSRALGTQLIRINQPPRLGARN